MPRHEPPFPVDLHNHSDRSKDGAGPGELLLDLALERGLQVLGICEHDAFPDPELVEAGARRGLRVELGVEFTCARSHVIGWRLQPSPADLQEMQGRFAALERNYREVTLRMLELLAQRGINVSYNTLAAYAGKTPQKVFLMRYLAEELDLFQDWADARRYLMEEGLYIGDNDGLEQVHPAEVVELIRRCGGVAVWAHPFFTPEPLQERYLLEMVDAGLDALETAYAYRENGLAGSRGNLELAHLAQGLATAHGLLQSGGSDSHYPIKTGPDGAPLRPGDFGLDFETARGLLERLAG